MKVKITPNKTKIRIDKEDTWSMDTTLGLIILPMLKQLKENNHGAPATDDVDVPEKLRSSNAGPKENAWDTDDLWFDRWDYVMDEMIWTFEQIINPDHDKDFFTHTSNPKALFGSDCTINKEGHDAHEDRINNGTRLFGKYYRNLWD